MSQTVWWRRLEDFAQTQRWFLVLFGVVVWVALANYAGKVWLTGWDTLHPEFDYGLNFGRLLDGAWRGDQGLGAVAAHAHMSELPRLLMLWLLDLVLPTQTVKYVFVLLCLVLGPLGVYVFAYANAPKKFRQNSLVSRDFVAFVAGLLFLCNLGTVQQFYVIFEMFAVQFAAIGWLFYLAFEYLRTPNKRLLALWALVGFLSAPMAYASTLWLALFAGFTLFLAVYIALSPGRGKLTNNAIILLVTWLGMNLFWLLPNAYFLLSTASNQVSSSHINQLFSPEVFYHNQAFGNWRDFPLLKSFLFNWTSYDYRTGNYSQLLEPWIEHLRRPFVVLVGYLIFGLSVLGAVASVRRKEAALIALVPVVLLTSFMLLNENPPLGWLFSWIRETIPLFEEGFRTPFTKFSILHMFGMAVFGAVGVAVLGRWLTQLPRATHNRASTLLIAITLLANFWFFLPAFGGNLIANKLKRDIPQEYFALFEFAQTLPANSRIAQLPMQTYAGWDYTSWGYEGPGFAWFGLHQPLLVRDFDRWNPGNEDFYNQASQAIYNEDAQTFVNLLDRYNVQYLLVDNSIITPGKVERPGTVTEALLADTKFKRIWAQGELVLYGTTTWSGASTATALSGRSSYARLQVTNRSFYELGGDTAPTDIFPFHFLTQDRALGQNNTWQPQLSTNNPRVNPTGNDEYSVVFPKENALTTSVVFAYRNTNLYAHFAAQPSLILDNHTVATLPQPTDLTIPLTSSPAALVVGINGVFTKVDVNQVSRPVIFSYPADGSIPPVIHFGDFVEDIPLAENIGRSAMGQALVAISSPTEGLTISGDILHKLQLSRSEDSVNILPFADFQSHNCDIFRRGTISASILINSLEQVADQRGAVCSTAELQSGAPGDGLIIRVRGENLAGRSVKLYLRNALSGRSELEHLLPTGQFDVSFTVLNGKQWLNTDDALYPYILTLETRSFGQPARNSIQSVEVSPLSTSYLAGISLHNISSGDSTRFSAKPLQVLAPTITKIGNSRYQAFVEKIDEPGGILTLNQAYDPGWLAFPKLEFWKPLEHVRYNGWANGWLVSESGNITIMYWPQLFSFLGYVVLSISLIVLSWSALDEWHFFRKLENQVVTDRKLKNMLEKLRNLLEGKR